MKVLIPCDEVGNGYVPSIVEAYQAAGCEVVTGSVNFFQTSWHPDVLHLQWPSSLYGWTDLSIYGDPIKAIGNRLRHFQQLGTRILWTVHNVRPHATDLRGIDGAIYQLIVDAAEIVIHHGKASVELMCEAYPGMRTKSHLVCRHGDYRIQYHERDPIAARRELRLPLDRRILMHFGTIWDYKGYDIVPRVFSGWKERRKYLLTAGALRSGRGVSRRLFRLR